MNDMSKLKRELQAGKYEKADSGIYLPASRLMLQGVFTHNLNGEDEQVDCNIVTNAGLDHVLSIVIAAGTQVTSWFVGLLNNYTPIATSTMANAGGANEFQVYSEAARQGYTPGAVAAQSVDNSAAQAAFSINGAGTVYGAFITDTSTKAGTTGTLLAGTLFAASRTVANLDTMNVQYTLTASDV